jgi:hypothetical protein
MVHTYKLKFRTEPFGVAANNKNFPNRTHMCAVCSGLFDVLDLFFLPKW